MLKKKSLDILYKCYAMQNVIAFELYDENHFRIIGASPDWFRSFSSSDDDITDRIELQETFPFLESFLFEADVFWKNNTAGKLESEFWIEENKIGDKFALGASAVCYEGEKIFLVKLLEDAYKKYHSVLQKGREIKFDYELLEKAEAKLKQANMALEKTRQDLAQKNKQLIGLNEEINTFLGMAAHDLRNPLIAIQQFSKWLFIEPDSFSKNERDKFLSDINRASTFMLKLVSDLLDISKIESGKVTLNKQNTNLIALIQENIMINSIFADKKRIRIIFNNKIKKLCLSIDADKINQVLNNLLTNAVKFSYPDSDVEVFLRDDDCNNVIISVRDAGKGIPTDELHKIFKPFEKISVTTTDGESSHGLGLAICQKIIQAHQGKVWVNSEVGAGSTFFVSLPV